MDKIIIVHTSSSKEYDLLKRLYFFIKDILFVEYDLKNCVQVNKNFKI